MSSSRHHGAFVYRGAGKKQDESAPAEQRLCTKGSVTLCAAQPTRSSCLRRDRGLRNPTVSRATQSPREVVSADDRRLEGVLRPSEEGRGGATRKRDPSIGRSTARTGWRDSFS
mmetsp:Transcript_18651/g.58665  ORF Transcript_18651/g.58665 Transcript_18651/m.58665 type:complete len:114 (+) Transcript_18651:123-464(+)